jgi:hypothetical protein
MWVHSEVAPRAHGAQARRRRASTIPSASHPAATPPAGVVAHPPAAGATGAGMGAALGAAGAGALGVAGHITSVQTEAPEVLQDATYPLASRASQATRPSKEPSQDMPAPCGHTAGVQTSTKSGGGGRSARATPTHASSVSAITRPSAA